MADIFSDEGLLDTEMVMEDPVALMMYESQLLISCMNVDDDDHHVSIDSSSMSWPSGFPVLSAQAEPPAALGTEKSTTEMATSSHAKDVHDQNNYLTTTGNADSHKRPQVLSFDFGSSDFDYYKEDYHNLIAPKRSASHRREHVLVERRRREKLAEGFLQLTAAVPGLNKKMDKASVIEKAAKHIKQLQERVKLLEQQQTNDKTDDGSQASSIVILDNDGSSSVDDTNISSATASPSLEVEAKVSERDVLIIRIHCKMDYNFMPKILDEIVKLHLRLLTSNIMPFGKDAMNTTIVAQMGDEFSMTLEDLMEHLRVCLQQL